MSIRHTAIFVAIAISTLLSAAVHAQTVADIPVAATTASQATEAGAAFERPGALSANDAQMRHIGRRIADLGLD